MLAESVSGMLMCQSNWGLSATPLKLSKHNVRNRKACCRVRPYRTGTVPAQNPLRTGYAEPGLLVRNVVTRKICRPSAVYTASQKYTVVRGKVRPCRTGGRWTGAVAELLEPLYDVLRQYVLMPVKSSTDDIPVGRGGRSSGKTQLARLWVYVRDDRNAGSTDAVVWFAYQSGPEGIPSQNHWPVTAVAASRPMLTVVTGRYTNPGSAWKP